jgi:HEAT repeats
MKKFFSVIRKFWLLILGGIILWLVLVFSRPFEPHYQGKSLSAWAPYVFSSGSERNDAVEAIRHIGTNALPYAIKFCSTKDFEIKNKFMRWVDHQSGETTYGQFILSLGKLVQPGMTTQSKGMAIFDALGPMAKPAIPDLIKLLEDESFDTVNAASYSLTQIGPDAVPPLIDELTNQDEGVRIWAAFSLENMVRVTTENLKTAIHPAIPALIQMLNSENIYMQRRAAATLAQINQDAPLVVPALVEALKRETNYQSSNFMSDSWGFMRAIRSFQTNAQMAAPVLVEIIKNDPSGRANEALKTLQQIAPEIAEPYIQKFNAALTNPPPDNSITNLFYNYYGTGSSPNINTEPLPSALPAKAN